MCTKLMPLEIRWINDVPFQLLLHHTLFQNVVFYMAPFSEHYERCLFKYIENFTAKNWKFSYKNSDIFHISAEIRNLMETPVNRSFTI